MKPLQHDLESGSSRQDNQNGYTAKLWWATKVLAVGAVVAGGVYFGAPYLGVLLGAIAAKPTTTSDASSSQLARRTTTTSIEPLTGVKILSDGAILDNSQIVMEMQNATTGQSVTVWSEFNYQTASYRLVAASCDDLNFRNEANNQISFLGGASQPTLASSVSGYTAAWVTAAGASSQVNYQFLNLDGGLVDPLALELAGSNVRESITPPSIIASSPFDFIAAFGALEPTSDNDITFIDSPLYIQQISDGITQNTEAPCTSPSYVYCSPVGGGCSVIYHYYTQPLLIQDNVYNTYLIYAFNYGRDSPAASDYDEIKYILSPLNTISQGTSLTNTDFPNENYRLSSPNAIVLSDNRKLLSFLVRKSSDPVNNFNLYIRLLNSAMSLKGSPFKLPIATSDLYGTPVPVKTSYGFGLFFSGNLTNPQAYFMGFDYNQTVGIFSVHINATKIFPSFNPQKYTTGRISSHGNIIARWQEKIGRRIEIRSVLRTPNLQSMMPRNDIYIQDQTHDVRIGITIPIDVNSRNAITTLTVSIPAEYGTLAVDMSALSGTAEVITITPTHITLQTNSTSLFDSIIQMNKNTDIDSAIKFNPAQYKTAAVPFIITACAGPYTSTKTINLPGRRVDYPPTGHINITIIQHDIISITEYSIGCHAINDVCTMSINNNQYCEFRRAIDPTIKLTSKNYNTNSYVIPPLEKITLQDVAQGYIWFRHTGEPVKPIFDLIITTQAGLSTTISSDINFVFSTLTQATQSDFTTGQKVGVGVSLATFAIGTAWQLYGLHKNDQKRWHISGLGYLLRDKLGITGVRNFDDKDKGAQYAQAINEVADKLNDNHQVSFAGLERHEQELLAQKLADFFNSAAGQQYLILERTTSPGSSTITYRWNQMANICYAIKELKYGEVKRNATTIAAAVFLMFDAARQTLGNNHDGDEIMMENLSNGLHEQLLKKK